MWPILSFFPFFSFFFFYSAWPMQLKTIKFTSTGSTPALVYHKKTSNVKRKTNDLKITEHSYTHKSYIFLTASGILILKRDRKQWSKYIIFSCFLQSFQEMFSLFHRVKAFIYSLTISIPHPTINRSEALPILIYNQ